MSESEPLPEEMLAALRASGDQIKAGTSELAGMLVTFRGALVQGGYSTQTAETLAAHWFGVLMRSSNG